MNISRTLVILGCISLSTLGSTQIQASCQVDGASDFASQKIETETIYREKGEPFTVSLSGNKTPGSLWVLKCIEPAGSVKLTDQDYARSSKLIGAGGLFNFHFDALKEGTTTITFEYIRPGENKTGKLARAEIIIE